MKWTSAAVLLVIVAVFADDTDTVQNDLQELGNRLGGTFPPGLENLPGGLNASQLPTAEEAERLLEEKCNKNGGPGAFQRAKNARTEVTTCAQSLVNVTELQAEMEEAKPHGDLDTVFRKYCQKSPQLSDCITNFTAALEPCMEEREKESKRIAQNITEALLKFVCYKEGDRIALFIAEGGPECLQSKEEQIKTCVNETVGKLVPADMPNINSLPLMVLGEKECKSISELQKCVVTELEACTEPTPANIVESLFNFIIRMTPCDKQPTGTTAQQVDKDVRQGNGVSSTSAVALGTLFLSVGAAFLSHMS